MSTNQTSTKIINLSQLVASIPVRRNLVNHDDRDKFEWSQWQSATKAMNNVESPAKEKHIRNLILGTTRLEGSRLFWSMALRIHIESDPVVCWKFSYAVHRLLKDGHKNVIHDCILLLPYFDQLCKYWSGVKQGYGLLIYRYCYLIVSKIKFHERNPTFQGTLVINERKDIGSLFQENYNLYFQLCIELFYYMEELLNLIETIFTSLDQSRSNSMSTAGQCRLNPLIICIQDSSLLYDYIVKTLFKLHEGLSGETLQGHRQRLADQFRRLKRFYGQASTLQYYKNLIKVPILPENPPNFNLKRDLINYQTPVAVVTSTPSDSSQVVDDLLLIDMTTSRTTANDDLSATGTMYQRSKEISDLEQRLMQSDVMLKESRSETDDLHRTIAAKDTEILTERNHRLQIEQQLRQQLDNQQRIQEMNALDNKTNSDEKFNKLLDTYNKMRDEHSVVLRREGEIKKQLADIDQHYKQLKGDQQKKEEEFNQNYEKVNKEIIQLRQTNDELQDRIQVLTSERNDYQSRTITTTERIKQIEHAKQAEHRHLSEQTREHEEDLIDLLQEKEALEQKVLDLEETIREWAQKFIHATDKQRLTQTNEENLRSHLKRQYKHSILTHCINQMHDGIAQTKDLEILNVNSGRDYLLTRLPMAVTCAERMQNLWKNQNESDEATTLSFLNDCITLANHMTEIFLYGKAVSNLRQNVKLANHYRDATVSCIDLYTAYQTSATVTVQSSDFLHRLGTLIEATKSL